jgi:hypothetical protein
MPPAELATERSLPRPDVVAPSMSRKKLTVAQSKLWINLCIIGGEWVYNPLLPVHRSRSEFHCCSSVELLARQLHRGI